jgi:hypothetical protein
MRRSLTAVGRWAVLGKRMSALATKSLRVKAAVALAVVYGFCVLLPAFAFALADGRMAPPCLVEELAAVSVHDHSTMHDHNAATAQMSSHHHAVAADAHAAAHHHGAVEGAPPPADHEHGKSRPGECCGLFPLMAFADGLPGVLAPSRLTSTVIPVMIDAMVGRGPDRIIRPPIA